MKAILIVDDLPEVRRRITTALTGLGAPLLEAGDGVEALAIAERDPVGIVVSDIRMPRMGGLELLRALRGRQERVILHSGFQDMDAAVSGLRLGALDVLPAPLDFDRLRGRIEHCLGAEREPRTLVGGSAILARLRRRIAKIAAADEPVLITGESGVGKEMVARAIHEAGPRRSGPFVAVNLCALAPGTLESELFGHERGAFTGACVRRVGCFERAHGGTLLLDEIGDASPRLQAKLLRVVETRSFERVGGTDPVTPDLRILAATHRVLPVEVAQGRFREDLWYRLAALRVDIPPLRERPEDVAALVDLELRVCSEQRGGTPFELDGEGRQALRRYEWPGNARQVRTTVRRMAILAGPRRLLGALDVAQALDVDRETAPGAAGEPEAPAATARHDFDARERAQIVAALNARRWNVSATARDLGLSRGALRNRMSRLGLRATKDRAPVAAPTRGG